MLFRSHTILFSGKESREHHGVAIWVHRKTASCLTSYNAVSSRVMSTTFAAKPRNVTVIQCYAPTADKADEEADRFYQEVSQVLAETPKKNLLLITGDFNARVGEDAEESEVLGRYGHGERNERGQTLVDFCAEHKLVITNTLFRLHNRHRYTWKSPDGITRTQIDYIMISKQWKQSISNARTCLSADCDSDHNLVVLTMQLRFKKKHVKKPLILDFEKFKSDQVREQYQLEVSNRFDELQSVQEQNTPDEL